MKIHYNFPLSQRPKIVFTLKMDEAINRIILLGIALILCQNAPSTVRFLAVQMGGEPRNKATKEMMDEVELVYKSASAILFCIYSIYTAVR